MFVSTLEGKELLSSFCQKKSVENNKKDWQTLNPYLVFTLKTESTNKPTELKYTKPVKLSGDRYKRVYDGNPSKLKNRSNYKCHRCELPDYDPRIPKKLRGFLLNVDDGLCYIYAIRCGINGKVYIGKTKSLNFRADCHLDKLRRRSHINSDLQADWIKWQEHNFTMEVIDTCPESELAALETHYIRKFANRAYNIVGNDKRLTG